MGDRRLRLRGKLPMAQLLVSGILLGGVYALIALGLTLVFGVMRVINFAYGDIIMVAMYMAFWGKELLHIDPYISAVALPLIFFALGMTVLRPFVLKLNQITPLAQTFSLLGVSIALQNLALMLWTADFRSVSTSYSSTVLHVGTVGLPLARLVAFSVALLTALGIHLFINRTTLGRAIRATAQDPRVAALMGVNVNYIYTFTFALSLALAALAGGIMIPVFYIYPTFGFEMGIIAFVVIVLGGLGSVPGAVLAGLLIGLVETFSGFWIAENLKQLVYFTVFIAILVGRPSGLLGQRGAEEYKQQ